MTYLIQTASSQELTIPKYSVGYSRGSTIKIIHRSGRINEKDDLQLRYELAKEAMPIFMFKPISCTLSREIEYYIESKIRQLINEGKLTYLYSENRWQYNHGYPSNSTKLIENDSNYSF